MKKSVLFILIAFIFFSCQKMNDCFTDAGEQIIQEVQLDEFDSVFVDDYFIVHLVQDTVNLLRIKGYESFVAATEYSIENNSLTLRNTHRCKFSKPNTNHTEVFLHINKIDRIRLNASAKLDSQNELVNEDEIGLIISSKYSEVHLNLDCRVFYYWNTHLNGGKINLRGNIDILKLWNTSLGSVDARYLEADKVLVDTDSKADCFVIANNELYCTVRGEGNVYCFGNPAYIERNDTSSTGKLIFVE